MGKWENGKMGKIISRERMRGLLKEANVTGMRSDRIGERGKWEIWPIMNPLDVTLIAESSGSVYGDCSSLRDYLPLRLPH